MISSRRLTQYIHEEANEMLKTRIFPVLRNDKITNTIRYDDLLIKFGNKLSEKYSLSHQHDMVRSHLRLLGRFKLAFINLCPKVELFKEIYKPQLYNDCVKALREVSGWDNNMMWFKSPAVAQSLTSLIKKCGYKQRTEYIKTQEDGPKKDLEDFLLLWEEETPTLINKKALEDQSNYKRSKKTILPPKEDINKLYNFLKSKISTAIKVLEKEFVLESWKELMKATLIYLQIFNRRRAGDLERITEDNYDNQENITDNMDSEQVENMSKESLEFAKQYRRITTRGKLNRTVTVLLSPLSELAIDLIIKHKKAAGIPESNKYIFCRTGSSKLSKQYIRACPLLRQFSMECGAAFPESLRGTT
ncbi:hypothetical protein EVAR_73624_1 [Eumeta japonica]|uniref:Uncharacterized protein n=1 Tax=Eumeta variegata TaxID=151549 RepID=A0A4C1TNI6_EUMVA|nr:hypothetical protein EVAR_73624_1 [Eumeta japonica]